MHLTLVAIDSPLAAAWQSIAADLDFLEVHKGNIFEVKCDAVVSPANSFGFMDGGIDLVYSRHFGGQVQERLQEVIREHHHGELLVGTAEIVETGDVQIPYLIAAPTMRVPTILKDTVNPYLATRALLLLVKHGTFRDGPLKGEPIGDAVQSLALPGLGTGVGKVAPEVCARQVRAAIEEVLLERNPFPESWDEAQHRHQLLYRDWSTDLQAEN